LQSFIDEGVWDEIRKIENEKLKIEDGLVAPVFNDALRVSEFNLLDDKIEIYKPRKLVEADHYYTIEKPSLAEFKDKASKFIAYAFPIANSNEFKEKLAIVKKEHPKATHHCFAYRIGLGGNNLPAGQAGSGSDDGEPAGTAGRPILGQIDRKELTNILIIVVRYFGGTLLGVPGLINAYKTACFTGFATYACY
jgi:hypothetical protein